jgi:DNA-binding GntR family transcriptional regulator
VVTAVLARDGAAAESAMRAHLEATRGLLMANLRR